MDYLIYFIIAALSGMGVGSAGLLVAYLTSLRGVPQINAQGINILFFLIATSISLLYHMRKRNLYPKIIITTVLFALPGVISGAVAVNYVPTSILRKIFGGMLVILGAYSVGKLCKEIKNERSKKL